MRTERTRERLYKEYAEAGILARTYEQHARTSVQLFVPFAAANLAYLLGSEPNHRLSFILAALGLIFSLVTLTVVYRVREFGFVANSRAVEIERQLGMVLYRRLKERASTLKFTPKNKHALMWVVAAFFVIFLVITVLSGIELAKSA